MKFFVDDVFQDVSNSFLTKIKDYHDETTLPIFLSIRLKPPSHSPEEVVWLRDMEKRLLPHHLRLVQQYLPITVIQKARETHMKSHYYKYKLQVAFIENALQQVQEYDPFFFTMDEVHESDMLLTESISKKLFYQEKIMNFP